VLLGMCTHQQLADIYPSADLFVFPSTTETFGNVTLESLASGTPVLAFNCAAAKDLLIPQHNGWLVEAGDVNAFLSQARAIAQDVETLQAMRAATAASVAEQGWDHIVGEVERVFRSTLMRNERA
jgi:glycosyltransferase involved in cell wall biosynthesis